MCVTKIATIYLLWSGYDTYGSRIDILPLVEKALWNSGAQHMRIKVALYYFGVKSCPKFPIPISKSRRPLLFFVEDY